MLAWIQNLTARKTVDDWADYAEKIRLNRNYQSEMPVCSGETAPNYIENIRILKVPVSAITMTQAVSNILSWAKLGQARFVCVRDVHGIMIASKDPQMMQIHHAAGMVTPDGMPLVWVLKWRASQPISRVCGTDLVDALCEAGQTVSLRHYFYGGKPGVAEAMIQNLKHKYPAICVAGFHSPPFGRLTESEDTSIVNEINKSNAQIVWVGLSTPKQERWMYEHVDRIKGATLIGVGAAFDFHSKTVSRAPTWMQKGGLEWLHRLASEPRRLWRRYMILAPTFAFKVILEQIEIGLFNVRGQSR